METIYNYAEAIWVQKQKLTEFLNCVAPQSAFALEDMGEDLYSVSFSSDADLASARKWMEEKKNYSIAINRITLGELRKLLEELPDDYAVSFAGAFEGFINVYTTDKVVIFDTTTDYMEEYNDYLNENA